MSQVTIRCPHCAYSRKVPADKIPAGAKRVTCPQCKQAFQLETPPSIATNAAAALQPPPAAPAPQAPPTPVPPSRRPGPTPPLRPSIRRGLMPIGELFDQTWTLYKRRAVTLILLSLTIILLILLPVGALAGLGMLVANSGIMVLLLVLLGLLAVSLLATWGGAAFVCATVDEELGVGEALSRSREHIMSFLWLFTLLGFIICGGYLLLIIPGILFTVWFYFAQYVLVAEDTRGMTALLKSREYVRGYGWGVFGRLLLVMTIGAVLGAVPLVGPFLSFAFTPYSILCMFLVYQELRELKGEMVFDCGTKVKAQWLVRGAAGYLLLPLLLLALYGPMLYQMGRSLADGNWSALAMPELTMSKLTMSKLTLPGGAPEPPPLMPETIRPADLPLLYGSWSGTELGSDATWTFEFEPNGYEVTVQRPDGGWYAGQAVIRFDIGERDGSLRVPPGWGVLDIDVTSASVAGQAGGVALGTFSVHGDELKLCLGEPGETVRAEEFAAAAGIRCFALARAAGTAGTPVYEYPADSGRSADVPATDAPTTAVDKLDDISVFIYAANYTGGVRINGKEFKTFGGKKDMQYNYSSFGDDFFQLGENTIEIDYAPLSDLPPDYWLLEIQFKVSRGDTVLGNWKIKERDEGTANYTLDIPQ